MSKNEIVIFETPVSSTILTKTAKNLYICKGFHHIFA